MTLFLIMVGLIIIVGIVENYIHNNNLKNIDLKIHVNGTRGKSSITRLIAGALREAGYKTIAKTTGTQPRLIDENGDEETINRWGIPRIVEQMKIISKISQRKPDALVMECMAISPEMQWITENKMIKSNIGIISNVRLDHTDKMGASLEEIAETLSLSIPTEGELITSDQDFYQYFKNIANTKNTNIHLGKPEDVNDDYLKKFKYPVYKENIACALQVSRYLNIDDKIAIKGMQKAKPDPGTLRFFRYSINNKNIYLINAFAANDYISTLKTWNKWKEWYQFNDYKHLPIIGLYNNRSDRSFRLKQLAKLRNNINFKELIIMNNKLFYINKFFLNNFNIEVNIKKKSQNNATLLKDLITKYNSDIILFGLGNTKYQGMDMINFFSKNGVEITC